MREEVCFHLNPLNTVQSGDHDNQEVGPWVDLRVLCRTKGNCVRGSSCSRECGSTVLRSLFALALWYLGHMPRD